MAKKTAENEEVIVDVQEVYSKTETFIEDNKNMLTTIIGGLVLVIAGYFAYNSFYLKPLEIEAKEEMFMAEKYFRLDSFNLAIDGRDDFAGFIEIAENYSGTKTGDLANYYLGMAFLQTGNFENAIDALNNFDGEDEMLGTIALGAQGDAYLELNDYNKAAAYYEKAANRESNEFTSPLYLLKAGKTYELNSQFSDALSTYQKIKNEWRKSPEASDIDKYIARVETAAK